MTIVTQPLLSDLNLICADKDGNLPVLNFPDDTPVIYIRRNGKLDRSGGAYDIKPGKSKISKGKVIRTDGDNQGLSAVECVVIPLPGYTDKLAKDMVEDPLRQHFIDSAGWKPSYSGKCNVKGIEHIHKKFNIVDDILLADKVTEEIIEVADKFLNNGSLRSTTAKKLRLRPIQTSYFDKLKAARRNGHRCFATAIATGGGKTICALLDVLYSYDLGNIQDGDIVAMISPNKDAQQSFIDDIDSFFADKFNIVKQEDLLSQSMAKDKINLLLVGVQWMTNKGKTLSDVQNLESLYQTYGHGLSNVKMFIFDEAHRHFFGKNKENEAEKIVKTIMSYNPYTNWISGTAHALLANLTAEGWLKPGGSYSFTLAQLLDDRSFIDPNLPLFKWMQLGNVPKYPDGEANDLFTSGKLLSGNQQIELEDFVNKFFYSNGSHNLFNVGRKHILISVDTQSQVDCFKDMLEQAMPDRLKSRLDVIAITGDSDDKVTDLDKYKRQIKESKLSITVTCKRWLEAVNVPCWDTLMMLGRTETYEFMFQALGRLLRVYNGKKEVWVCDVKLNRHIEFFHNLRKELQAADQNLVEWDLKKLYSLMPIFFCNDVGFEQQKLQFDVFEDEMQNYVNTIQSNRDFFNDSDFNLKIDGLDILSNIGLGGGKSKKILMEVASGTEGKDVERVKKQLNSAGVELTNEDGEVKVKIVNLEKLKKLFKNIEA